MAYKLFIDSDVLLDILLLREPHFEDSTALLYLRMDHRLELFTSPSILLNVNYIAAKSLNQLKAKKGIAELLKFLEIIESTIPELVNCFNNNYTDVEDAVQYFTAIKNVSIQYYITRNIKHFNFKRTELPVLTPTSFLKMLSI